MNKLFPTSKMICDGKIHRIPVEGDRGSKKSGWYLVHDGPYNKTILRGNWKTGTTTKEVIRKRAMTPEEIRDAKIELRRKAEEKIRKDAEEKLRKQQICIENYLEASNSPLAPEHVAYLQKKGIQHHAGFKYGMYYKSPCLIVPLCAKGVPDDVIAIQVIYEIGSHWTHYKTDVGFEKRFPNGRVEGYFLFGIPVDTVFVCEGVATAASVYEATGIASSCVFCAGNLLRASVDISHDFKGAKVVICADADSVGVDKAMKAAKAVHGIVVIPEESGKDWNDIAQEKGLDYVKSKILEQLEKPVISF